MPLTQKDLTAIKDTLDLEGINNSLSDLKESSKSVLDKVDKINDKVLQLEVKIEKVNS